MLRATTDVMVNVFVVIVGAGRACCGVCEGAAVGLVGKVVAVVVARRRDRAAARPRREVLGRGGDGRRGDHPVLPALARPQPGASRSATARAGTSRSTACSSSFFLVLGYLGIAAAVAASATLHRRRSARSFYFGFFLLMPWWSRLGDVQAGARPRDLPRALSREPTRMKKLILTPARWRSASPRGAPRPNEGDCAWDKAPEPHAPTCRRCRTARKLFVNYCLNCHSAAYMRYNRLQRHRPHRAADQGQPAVRDRQGRRHDEGRDRPEARPRTGSARVPPDLSLVARSRAGPRRHRRRLPLHLPAHLLPRRHRGRPAGTTWFPERRHAARAVAAAGRAASRSFEDARRRTATRPSALRAAAKQVTPGHDDAAAVRRRPSATWSPTCSGWPSRRRTTRVRVGVWVLIFLASARPSSPGA